MTDRFLQRCGKKLALLLVLFIVASCGVEEAQVQETAMAPNADTALPNDLEKSLARGLILVADGTWAKGVSPSTIQENFAKEYDPRIYTSDGNVYALEIVSSTDSAMLAGTAVRVVYVPQVVRYPNTPRNPDGSTPERQEILTDMFAFFDVNGAFIQATFVGP